MRNFSDPSVRHQLAIGIANRINIMRELERDPEITDLEIAHKLNLSLSTVRQHRYALRILQERETAPPPVTTYIEQKKGVREWRNMNF